jgi:hypothetical protein
VVLGMTSPPDPVPDTTVHSIVDAAATTLTWDYEQDQIAGLRTLYQKAKHAQWDADVDLPWATEVDLEKNAHLARLQWSGLEREVTGTPLERFSERDFIRLSIESDNWMLSQFLHGEQGALACAAKIVATVPWIDAKYFAASQAMDEARHVEAFARYLREKHQGLYPINVHLRALLDDIISDRRWDVTYLGMQVMVEGMALAAFGFLHTATPDPLLRELLRNVMADEARHVAFGVLSLREHYRELTLSEITERQEFAYECVIRIRDRLLQQEVWERMGLDLRDVLPFVARDPVRQRFQYVLFSKIVPNCKKLGLLDAGDGWLRRRFTEMGVIAFEDAVEPSSG